jgi:glutathione peroxidase
MTTSVFDFVCQTTAGKDKPLSDYQDKVLLVVNTASKCGFTPQFEGLETLYEQYKDKGLEILGFPCNQFGKQDPGSNEEITEFCQLNYGVSFPMFGKIDVNGGATDPLYEHLKKEAPGALGTKAIKWNFTKFLVDSSGKVLKRYSSATKPKDIEKDIKKLLA